MGSDPNFPWSAFGEDLFDRARVENPDALLHPLLHPLLHAFFHSALDGEALDAAHVRHVAFSFNVFNILP